MLVACGCCLGVLLQVAQLASVAIAAAQGCSSSNSEEQWEAKGRKAFGKGKVRHQLPSAVLRQILDRTCVCVIMCSSVCGQDLCVLCVLMFVCCE